MSEAVVWRCSVAEGVLRNFAKFMGKISSIWCVINSIKELWDCWEKNLGVKIICQSFL